MRKIGCYESRKAEWSHRKVLEVSSLSLSSFFSLYFSVFLYYLPTYLLIYLSTWLSVCLSIYLPICLGVYLVSSYCLSISLSIYAIYLPIYLYIYLSINMSIYLSINLSIFPSLFLSTNLSIYLTIYLFIYLSIHPSIYLYISFDKVHNPLRLPREATSEPVKKVRTWCVLCIFTSKCASRHNGVHFFDISTSKSGPRMVCFVHFDLEMCFAPQRRALFRHRNFQKWSETASF